jgi:hypothetical protein
MKIAPYTERWNEGEQDWSFVENARPGIEKWERESGLKLPDAYRRFMLNYNGGYVYPRTFYHRMPIGGGAEALVAPLLSWKGVEENWRGDVYGEGVPPLHIVVGETAGSIVVLMSLAPETHGNIYSWLHSNQPWGSSQNTTVYFLADSFEQFLSSLHDDEEKSDYDGWYISGYDELVKEVEI